MNEKKVTKKEMLERVKGAVLNSGVENVDELVAFIEKEQNALNKKSKAKTENQKANEALIEVVYNELVKCENAVTVTELLKEEVIQEAGIKSPQKLSALLKKLVDGGRVSRIHDKKKSYFTIEEDI